MVPLTHYIAFSAVLFIIGAVGFLMRRNLIIMFMSIEIMMNAVNVNLVAFSRHWANLNGQVFAIFVITVAAAEAAVGLAILISLYRHKGTVSAEDWRSLKG